MTHRLEINVKHPTLIQMRDQTTRLVQGWLCVEEDEAMRCQAHDAINRSEETSDRSHSSVLPATHPISTPPSSFKLQVARDTRQINRSSRDPQPHLIRIRS